MGGGRRGAGITRKEGNVPAKARHYTEAKEHFFNGVAPGDKAAGTRFYKLNYTLMKIPGHSCKSRGISGSWDACQIPVKVTTLFPYGVPATSVNVVNCFSSKSLCSIPGMYSSLG